MTLLGIPGTKGRPKTKAQGMTVVGQESKKDTGEGEREPLWRRRQSTRFRMHISNSYLESTQFRKFQIFSFCVTLGNYFAFRFFTWKCMDCWGTSQDAKCQRWCCEIKSLGELEERERLCMRPVKVTHLRCPWTCLLRSYSCFLRSGGGGSWSDLEVSAH